ncbi:hypothetical protein [Corynebacterium phocae]|uniref:hypothetical protein n=1 Tax=Corynebacterium phocae TaxID=161895 RepID=UPI001478D80C|nr:hypothetical protein [Corynebacterium phocae]
MLITTAGGATVERLSTPARLVSPSDGIPSAGCGVKKDLRVFPRKKSKRTLDRQPT